MTAGRGDFPWPFLQDKDVEAILIAAEERAARLVGQRDLIEACIPADAPEVWREWFRAELTRLFDEPA
jgi:hypothetical protein